MNTHRVTLTAFSTTGVLLAASLTMLAIVSALVTFDAWPTRQRGATPAEIAVENPKAAKVVRAVRGASSTTGGAIAAVGASAARGVPGAAPPTSGPGDGGGGGGDADVPTIDPPSTNPTPTPRVGPSPPGEDPNPGPPVRTSDSGLVDQVTDTACGTVSATCGVVPGSSDGGSMDAPPPVDLPADVPALP